MRFDQWYFLLAIPLILMIMQEKKRGALPFSSIALFKKAGIKTTYKHKIGKGFVILSLCLFTVALARPQVPSAKLPRQVDGIDIATILDVSESMQSVDFEPSRLEVARDTIEDFVKERFEDRISFIVFAGTAYTRVPLTLDHNVVLQSLDDVQTDSVSESGTAIGMAISVGVNRLKDSDAKSKIMILVTDGDNNAGTIDPETASKLAEQKDIKIYTIGVGTDKTVIPVNYMGMTRYQTYNSGLDEDLLEDIADKTGGKYFRAKDADALEDIFDDINTLEKTDFDQDAFQMFDEMAFVFIKIGLVCLLLGLIFDRYIFVQIP